MIAETVLTVRDTANRAVYERQRVHCWRGVALDKCAGDLLTYQEIITAKRPEIIIETGSWAGGSGLFFADMCELVESGDVLSIDIQPPDPLPYHELLGFMQGDSVDRATIEGVHRWANGRTGMVILDSDHSKAHVLKELDCYAPFVALGGYLIVEDTNVNGHPVRPEHGPGPWEAVQEWLPRNPDFEVDFSIEPYLTFAPGGYLCRMRQPEEAR